MYDGPTQELSAIFRCPSIIGVIEVKCLLLKSRVKGQLVSLHGSEYMVSVRKADAVVSCTRRSFVIQYRVELKTSYKGYRVRDD